MQAIVLGESRKALGRFGKLFGPADRGLPGQTVSRSSYSIFDDLVNYVNKAVLSLNGLQDFAASDHQIVFRSGY